MDDVTEINQKAGLGSEVTQIGTQNIYTGLTPSEACKLATDLFYENFPKLQEQAKEMIIARVNELMAEVAKKLSENNVSDLSAFAQPDVQYAILEGQKSYARFGTEEMLSTLSSLITSRVQNNTGDISLRVAIDKAIEVTGLITTKHLDYLALLFAISQVKYGGIDSIEQLSSKLQALDWFFPNVDTSSFIYLNSLGCLQLNLFNVCQNLSKTYGFPKNQIEKICPANIKQLTGDYTTSHVGTILAITHLESVTPYRYDPTKWIHG